jgi:hypothetical protein
MTIVNEIIEIRFHKMYLENMQYYIQILLYLESYLDIQLHQTKFHDQIQLYIMH